MLRKLTRYDDKKLTPIQEKKHITRLIAKSIEELSYEEVDSSAGKKQLLVTLLDADGEELEYDLFERRPGCLRHLPAPRSSAWNADEYRSACRKKISDDLGTKWRTDDRASA